MRGRFTSDETRAAEKEERDAALAAFGLVLEGPSSEPPEFWLWPEHRLPFALWFAGQSCMRRGMAGPEGLDYVALRELVATTRCERLPSSPRRRAAVWADVRTIERAALSEWAEVRAEQAARGRR